MIEAYYNPENNNKVIGYYPKSIEYNNKPDFPYIEITEEQQKPFLNKDAYIINGILDDLPGQDLKDLKVIKLQELKDFRKHQQYLPVSYKGSLIPNTEKAKTAILAKSSGWNGKITKPFLDVEGNIVNYSQPEYEELKEMIEEQETSLYIKESNIIKTINSISNIEILESFNIEEQWNLI